MNKPHKHAELIKAWADGAQIQYRNEYVLEWKDCALRGPEWEGSTEYRVKPEAPPDWHRGLTVGIRIVFMASEMCSIAGFGYLSKAGFKPEDFQ